MNFLWRMRSIPWLRLAAKGSLCLLVMNLTQQNQVKNAFEYGYYIPKYEDRAMYFEKTPSILKKGTLLGNKDELPTQIPVLRELPGGSVYLCKVFWVKRA